jgi:DNA-binding NarL/FixJ family response regulator
LTQRSSACTYSTLTLQEGEILAAVSTGLSNGSIAKSLSISLSTVKARLRSIYRKLAVTDRTTACARAMEMCLLPASEAGHLGSESRPAGR